MKDPAYILPCHLPLAVPFDLHPEDLHHRRGQQIVIDFQGSPDGPVLRWGIDGRRPDIGDVQSLQRRESLHKSLSVALLQILGGPAIIRPAQALQKIILDCRKSLP